MKLNQLTITSARKKLDKGEISTVDLVKDCLEAIKHHNRKLNACLVIDEKGALAAAREADRQLKTSSRQPLLGIPFLAKDNIMTKGLVTTAGSMMLKNYVAPYDATVIVRLKKAGAILLGKTNLDEFAHGASTEYSAFGPTKNPWDLSRVAGGSSGGSAAAVAAGLCLFALGTDTGGSVRHPAALCGVVGLKPTYGLCSRFGLIAMTSSTDVPGCLTKTVADAALVLQAIAGYDPKDVTTVSDSVPAYDKLAKTFNWKGVRVGIPKEVAAATLSPIVKKSFDRTIQAIKRAGGTIVSISLPSNNFALAAYYIITPSEISSNLARFDGLRFGGKRETDFGPEVKRRIMLGTYCLSAGYYDAYYLRAQKVRTKIIAEFNKAFARCDFIMTPTTPTPAFKIGAKNKKPLLMYLEDMFLVPQDLTGLPAVSVPASRIPLPVGIHLIAPMLAEKGLLSVAAACENFAEDQHIQPEL